MKITLYGVKELIMAGTKCTEPEYKDMEYDSEGNPLSSKSNFSMYCTRDAAQNWEASYYSQYTAALSALSSPPSTQ